MHMRGNAAGISLVEDFLGPRLEEGISIRALRRQVELYVIVLHVHAGIDTDARTLQPAGLGPEKRLQRRRACLMRADMQVYRLGGGASCAPTTDSRESSELEHIRVPPSASLETINVFGGGWFTADSRVQPPQCMSALGSLSEH